MSSIPAQPLTLSANASALHGAAAEPLSRAESLQRIGKRLIVAGFVVTLTGVVLYSLVCFAGGMDASMADILMRGSVTFARATLGVLGLGTLIWLAGSFTYLKGMMDADESAEP